MSVTKRDKNISICIYAVFAVFYLWIASQIPYLHDDWDWGLDIGLQQLLYATVNSRYAGNFFVVIMTRSELLKTLIMGAVSFAIPYLLSSFAAKQLQSDTPSCRVFLFLICNGLLLTVSHVLWKQTCGWVSGYANFVISALFLLLWIREIQVAADGLTVEKKDSPAVMAVYFLICFFGQLFIENLSIFCFGLGAVLTAVYFIRCRKVPGRILSMTAAAFLGLIVMFSSSLYGSLFSSGTAYGGYREITVLSNDATMTIVFYLFSTTMTLALMIYSMNVPLTVVTLLLFIFLLLHARGTSRRKYHIPLLILDVLLIVFFILGWINDTFWQYDTSLITYSSFFCVILFFFAVLVQTFLLFQGSVRNMLVSLWFCAPMVLAPLIVTTETGPRLFFTPTVILLLFALILLASAINHMSKRTWTGIRIVAVCLTAVLLCFYSTMYAYIGQVKRTREEIIETAVESGQDTVTLPAYPFGDYLQFTNPVEDFREDFFKPFFGIPADVTVIYE